MWKASGEGRRDLPALLVTDISFLVAFLFDSPPPTCYNGHQQVIRHEHGPSGASLATGGPLMLVAQNGAEGPLEPGDVVAAAGLGQPFAGSPSPITLIRRADAAQSQPVAGVVYRRFVAEEKAEEQEHNGQVEHHTYFDTHTTEGAIAPGEYLLLCVLGPCQVKADADQGSIRPGDVLAASHTQGRAARARPLALEGVTFYPPGATFGTALEPLDQGTGLIYMLVTLR